MRPERRTASTRQASIDRRNLGKEGRLFDEIGAAEDFAIESARDIMKHEVGQGRLCLGCAIVVRGEHGARLFAVSFADAVTVTFAGDACQ